MPVRRPARSGRGGPWHVPAAPARKPQRIEFEQAALVAGAYLDAPRSSNDPVVHAAYAELANQADRLFESLTSDRVPHPVRVVFTARPGPYAHARDIADAVVRGRVLEVSPSSHDRYRRHPLLDSSPGGSYDRFRAVHDIVSHGWLRCDFDRHGEFAAWLSEDRMYTGLARWALAAELHAQHSVRWTSGDIADLKAVLLDPRIIAASHYCPANTQARRLIDGTRPPIGVTPCPRTARICQRTSRRPRH